ncbi:C69 family dipeptidase [Vagococcus vulneris]|uniref:Dipeptidase n=1 Tax=Vagococcus vulneris TaxID=1977869 RepID=A0A429ZYT3_9ENTE|nr:C69 family dipeptidase [Vagococcus vulneris]RST99133.1 peptidase C69 [Vagococcus vulneris]
MCTTVIVGKKATIDGSTLNARNVDSESPIDEVKFIVVPEENNQTVDYTSVVTGVTIPLPSRRLRHQLVPNIKLAEEGEFGESGINSMNVGMSATESIYGNAQVLAIDPYVADGIGEDAMVSVVLPYITTAREGVVYLGELIEKYGSSEGNGVIFSDHEDVWYMEIPCGHHWIATKIPEDHCCVIANQVAHQAIDFNNTDNVLYSNGIQEFVERNSLNPDSDEWNFRHIFGTNTSLDRRYNTPRVWYGQCYLGHKTENPSSNDLPFTFKPNRLLTIEDVGYVLSSHYNDTIYDQLGDGSLAEKTSFRPIAMNRTAQSHIIQIRNHVSEDISGVLWLNSAPTAFNPYVPFYANADDTSTYYNQTSLSFNFGEAYWRARMIAVLVEQNYGETHTANNAYLTECQRQANAFITETDKLSISYKNQELTRYLTKRNQLLTDKIKALTLAHIEELTNGNLGLSALTYTRDKNQL